MRDASPRTGLAATAIVLWALTALAQSPASPAPSTQKPGMTPRPPLLFSEPWRLPPYTGEQTDENMRFTPAMVTHPNIEVTLYRSMRSSCTAPRITEASCPYTLHPVVRLADGRLIVGDRSVTTHGEFLTVEIAFSGMRWYALDPARVVVGTEVTSPDLGRVDEVGLAMLLPGGGHGIAGSANLSTVDLFAYPVLR